MRLHFRILFSLMLAFVVVSCSEQSSDETAQEVTAEDILGNPDYLAFSYGGYRQGTRDVVPTVEELKEDVQILAAMGVKLLRTYNTQQFAHAANLLEAIHQLKKDDPDFEMYVMLGAWIDCEGAWTGTVNHEAESEENNSVEVEAAIKLTQTYPDIVKIIAVGNEAMVNWAASYFVYPDVILRWVNHLKDARDKGEIPAGTWITSSDNFASWGGGAKSYHIEDLEALIKAVDFLSVHTYPFHDSHYNPDYWGVPEAEESLSELEQMDAAMLRARDYAKTQYQAVVDYMTSLGVNKPVHIGETGWASIASFLYGASGSRAADEYKEKLYYDHIREWTNEAGITCFYFEAFDEQWKDAGDALGSENHFGLINLKGEAKYALWDMVDEGVFAGLTRNGQAITKTYDGDGENLFKDVIAPPFMRDIPLVKTTTVHPDRKTGEEVSEATYVVADETLIPDGSNGISYPSAQLKMNAWEGTAGIELSRDGILLVRSGSGEWWGCAMELEAAAGENLSNFQSGRLHFSIKGDTNSTFEMGFQTGAYAQGTQVNNFVTFGPEESYQVTENWQSYSVNLTDMNQGADLTNVTAPIFFRGDKNFDSGTILLKDIYYTQE